MILKEELHSCPGCGFFTLKKGVFSCCEICSYRPNQFSEFFPIEGYQFEHHRNKESLYQIQQKSLKGLPIKSNSLNMSLKNIGKRNLNSPILYCLNAKEYGEDKVYEFFTRHPLWQPLEDEKTLSIKELYNWYNKTLKKSCLSELNNEGYISIKDNDLEKTIKIINNGESLHMCPACGFESLSGGLFSYDICSICFWEDDLSSVYRPCQGGGPNHESLIEVQGCIGKYIPLEIKEYHGYTRNLNWKPINVKEIKNKEKPFIEKWFYDKGLGDYKNDYDRELFEEAQKYNPTKY